MPELNNAHRDAILDATGAQFNGGTLTIYDDADVALVEIELPNPAFAASTGGGPIAKAGTWSGVNLETGAPSYYVLESSDETQTRTGSAGPTASGEDMEIADLDDGDIVQGGVTTVDTYTIAQPAGGS
jgi:hypothetical protein